MTDPYRTSDGPTIDEQIAAAERDEQEARQAFLNIGLSQASPATGKARLRAFDEMMAARERAAALRRR